MQRTRTLLINKNSGGQSLSLEELGQLARLVGLLEVRVASEVLLVNEDVGHSSLLGLLTEVSLGNKAPVSNNSTLQMHET